MNNTKTVKATSKTQKNKKPLTLAQIKKMMKMRVITHPDQIKPRKNQAEVNRRNFHILRTKLKGKLRLEEGETALSLLGRE